MGFWKSAGDTLLGIGKGICDTAYGLGETAVNGVKYVGKSAWTAVTDPVKFGNDVKDNVAGWGRNIRDSWNHGLDTVKEGIDQIQGGAGFYGLRKVIGGTIEAATGGGLGITDAWRDHVDAHNDYVTDEMGNVTAVQHEGLTWLDRVTTGGAGQETAKRMNENNEINEAIADGDRTRAFALGVMANNRRDMKALADTAFVAGTAIGAVAAPFTGGSSLGLGATIGGLVGTVSNMAEGTMAAQFDRFNLKDDVSDQVASEIAMLQAQGLLSEENSEKYGEVLTQYLTAGSYKGTNTPDRETFGFVVDANHLINNEAIGLQEQVQGMDIAPDSVPDADPQTKAGMAVLGAYQDLYGVMVADGKITQEEADGMTNLNMFYNAGAISDRDYVQTVMTIGTLHEYPNLACTRDQLMAYTGHCADYALGNTDENGFAESVYSDPALQEFIGLDGSFNIPEKDAGLEKCVTGADVPQYGQAPQPEVSEAYAMTRQDEAYTGPEIG